MKYTDVILCLHGALRVIYLINGATDEKAKTTLKDSELLQQFKAFEQMTDDDKQVVKKLIDAFIIKGRLKPLAL